MEDKEITLEFTDGKRAKIVKIEDLDTREHINKLSARIIELEEENKKQRGQLNSAFDNGFIHKDKIRDKIKEWDKSIKWNNSDDHYYAIKILKELLGE